MRKVESTKTKYLKFLLILSPKQNKQHKPDFLGIPPRVSYMYVHTRINTNRIEKLNHKTN